MIIPVHLILITLTAYTFTGSSAPNQGMDIVRDGRALAVIVAEEAPNNIEQSQGKNPQRRRTRGFEYDDLAAARVLADWIEKMTDVRLEIAGQSDDPRRPAIYIGTAAVKAGLDLSNIDSPTKEGMRIISDGKNKILIAGQNETSTIKAVCRFLEELGCRYFMDNELGEVYPRSKTITVGRLNIADKPGMMLRKIWGSKWSGRTLWKIWNGAGGLQLSTGHSWGRYVDQSLFDEHPEYFALRSGQRRKGGWYCTSNPEFRRVFTKGVISKGGFNPSVSPPDGNGYCQCENCSAQDDPRNIEPSSGRPSMTNRYVDFLNEVAGEVARTNPDWLLSFYCYADYTQPPTLNRRLSPNLVAWIAPIRYSRLHGIGNPNSSSRMQLAEVIDGWASQAGHIAYRTYNYNLAECLLPFSKLSIWKHDIPYLVKKGCIGINLESLMNWEIYGPHLYQSIRLAYDPDADSDAMMEDYFMKFYGPEAGPFMKEYWLSIDQAFANLKCESGSFYALHLVYTPRFLDKLNGLMKKAADAAKHNEKYTAHIAMTSQGLLNAEQYIRMRDAMNMGDFAAAKKIYDELYARNETEMTKGYGNHYTLSYLKRFVGTHVLAGARVTAPPARVLQVLPDKMKLTYDHSDNGIERGFHKPDFDDSTWKEVSTYVNPLNAQGLPDTKSIIWYRTSIEVPRKHGRLSLFFTEVDGQAVTVYINGLEVASLESQARRKPFEVTIPDSIRSGRNVVTVKVDHRRITELYLGGIIRPVLLIEKQ